LALLRDFARRVALSHLLILEWGELTEAAAARKQGDQQVDDESGQAETPAAGRQTPRPDTPAANVRDLARI
jgi:hypothetical protein